MGIYHRYASGEHDKAFFNSSNAAHRVVSDIPAPTANGTVTANTKNYSPSTHIAYKKNKRYNLDHSMNTDSLSHVEIDPISKDPLEHIQGEEEEEDDDEDPAGLIQLNPLSGQFDPYSDSIFSISSNSITEWLSIFPNAAYFTGFDESLFEHIVIIVYENLKTGKISTLSITKFGVVSYENLILDARSRFWPSCENLLPQYQKSNVRRALAITNLKNYNRLSNHPGKFVVNKYWDETTAGSIANNMLLLVDKRPDELGVKLLQLGLLQQHTLQSTILDVIYDNSSPATNPKIIEENNKLVFLLGAQLDQLFDPLLEYSPEVMDIMYSAPSPDTYQPPHIQRNTLIESIIGEIINVQTNYTMGLVNLLQNFIIPLRVFVLASSPGSGITKINQVFPPTIDEITRINCILHEHLAKASTLGYVEVLKVLGMTIPYFYKAFIRHEANLRNFPIRLNKFSKKNSKRIFDNDDINKVGFSLREIESIVSGSLLELPRLKLIMRRLYDTIAIEKSKLSNFSLDIDEDPEMILIEKYYKSAIETIDAFGYVEADQQAKMTNQNRVFTPTGKLLTELASGWPAELQYGWLSRKVVGIFELANVKEELDDFHNIDIMIIFSDHILFLNIMDDNYYGVMKEANKPFKKLSLADVLMHSLVNEKPLPSLSQFPSMKVKYWCDINDVVVSTYKSYSARSSSEEEFLRFINKSKIGFRTNNLNNRSFTQYYQVLKPNNTNPDSNKIIELINKSKVLHKSQPFHLFKSYDSDLHIYSTAHEKTAYADEKSKSPFVLFLSETIDNPTEYFENNPHVYLILCASFINDIKVEIVGYNRTNNFTIKEIIFSEDLLKCLKEILAKNYYFLFTSYNEITEILMHGYKDDLSYYANRFAKSNQQKVLQQHNIKQLENSNKAKGKSMLLSASSEEEVPERNAEENTGLNKSPVPLKRKKTNQRANEPIKTQRTTVATKPSTQKDSVIPKRRKSIIQKIFCTLKKHDYDQFQTQAHQNEGRTQVTSGSEKTSKPVFQPATEQQEVIESAEEAATEPHVTEDQMVPAKPKTQIPRNISNTPIPKGQRKKFSHIYRPVPALARSNTITSNIDQAAKRPNQARTSRVPSHSTTLNRSYMFPHPEVESELHEVPQNNQIEEVPRHASGGSVVIKRPFSDQVTNSGTDLVGEVDKDAAPGRDEAANIKPLSAQSQSVMSPAPLSSIPNIQTQTRSSSIYSSDNQSPYPSINRNAKRAHALKQWSSSESSQKTRIPSNDSCQMKSLTEENVLVLDTIPYKARSQERSIQGYDNIRSEDFYQDGETNWVTISRENSSLLEHQIRALKEVTKMDSMEVIDVKEPYLPKQQPTSTPLTDGPNGSLGLSDCEVASIYYSPSQELSPGTFAVFGDKFVPPFGYQTNAGKEDSMASLTSSQYIQEFGHQIENKFSRYGNLGSPSFDVSFVDNVSVSDNDTIQIDSVPSSASESEDDVESIDLAATPHLDIKSEYDGFEYETDSDDASVKEELRSIQFLREHKPTKPQLNFHLSSSDDEYFSTEEYARAIQYIHNNTSSFVNSKAETNYSMPGTVSKSTSPNTFRSSSSDATIINDCIQEATKQPVQEKFGARLLPTSRKGSDRSSEGGASNLEAPGFAIRYDSVAYLSDIINGTVNFNFNDDEDTRR